MLISHFIMFTQYQDSQCCILIFSVNFIIQERSNIQKYEEPGYLNKQS